jgi:ATP-dependent protease ClpP protease subunit
MTTKSFNYLGGKIEVAFDKADETPANIQIYDDIGRDPWTGDGFTAKDLSAALNEIPNKNRELRIAVNSRGGDVNEGKTIRSMLEDWPGRIVNVIDGVAASTASWMIPADEVHASTNHGQWLWATPTT